MKGKFNFTQSEANEIVALIRRKLKATTFEQVAIRNKIRALGFYASDFGIGGGYKEADFLRVASIIAENKIDSKPETIKVNYKISKTDNQVIGLEPICDENSHILILGTMPGEESLRRQEYYANPRNLFWKLVGAITGEPTPAVYRQKITYILHHGIALWDMCAVCVRSGSLDSNIKDEVPNDICAFLAAHPNIKKIGLNGVKSSNMFRRYVGSIAGVAVIELPSSSLANAGIPWEVKVVKWKYLL